MTNDEKVLVEYTLSQQEVEMVREAARAHAVSGPPTDPTFYDRNWDAHRSLPGGLVTFLDDFRRTEPAAICLIHGFPVADDAVGPTPARWERALDSTSTWEQDLYVAMCGLALGEPFSWLTLQFGAMIQNIFPVRGDEYRQSGHGSEAFLEFHTEDGFHPARCDYLLLFGIRNEDKVPTYVASVRDVRLTDAQTRILSQPRFLILPDDEHLRQLERRHPDHPALSRALEMQRRPEPVPVLFGDPAAPYIRIDRPFMHCVGDDPAAEEALDALMAALDEVRCAVVVEQGSLLVLDNYLGVHGRRAFRGRYDGTDRWLKRMIVSRDLRKSMYSCSSSTRRVLL